MSEETIRRLLSLENPDEALSSSDTLPIVILVIYELMIMYRNKKGLPLVVIKVELPWLYTTSFYYTKNINEINALDRLFELVKPLNDRIQNVNGKMLIEKKEIPVIATEKLAHAVRNMPDEFFKGYLVSRHVDMMRNAYVDGRNMEEAIFHAELVHQYGTDRAVDNNNAGYVFLSAGRLTIAKTLLTKALSSAIEDVNKALILYNLSIMNILENAISDASEKIENCIEISKNLSTEKRRMACLFVPEINEDKLICKEMCNNVDLLLTARKTQEIISRCMHSPIEISKGIFR